LRTVTAIATGGLIPDVTLWLQLDPAHGLARKQQPEAADLEWNRLDAHELAFHQRVARGYEALAQLDPDRWVACDATLPVERLAQHIYATLLPRLATVPRQTDAVSERKPV
jgi:dTMP kinase